MYTMIAAGILLLIACIPAMHHAHQQMHIVKAQRQQDNYH